MSIGSEQAIFQESLKMIWSGHRLAFQDRLRHQRPDNELITVFMRRDRRADAPTEDFDLAFVARFDRQRVYWLVPSKPRFTE